MNKYALIHDRSVQWFTYLVNLDKDNNILEAEDLDPGIKGSFISNLFNREVSCYLKLDVYGHYGGTDSFACWWISEKEYKRIQRIIELYSTYQEYLILTNEN